MTYLTWWFRTHLSKWNGTNSQRKSKKKLSSKVRGYGASAIAIMAFRWNYAIYQFNTRRKTSFLIFALRHELRILNVSFQWIFIHSRYAGECRCRQHKHCINRFCPFSQASNIHIWIESRREKVQKPSHFSTIFSLLCLCVRPMLFSWISISQLALREFTPIK